MALSAPDTRCRCHVRTIAGIAGNRFAVAGRDVSCYTFLANHDAGNGGSAAGYRCGTDQPLVEAGAVVVAFAIAVSPRFIYCPDPAFTLVPVSGRIYSFVAVVRAGISNPGSVLPFKPVDLAIANPLFSPGPYL